MLVDSYSRTIDYLRVSVTSNCNFRCLYCMPKIPFDTKFNEDVLSFDELFCFIKMAIDAGIKKIRITGGEPLLRDDLHTFIRMIFSYKSTVDLALTTNAFLLKQKAKDLKDAGLKRINISLDSLKACKLKKIAQKDILDTVLSSIDEAIRLGFIVKLNTVVLRGFNDDELIDLLEYARSKNIQIRFIEFMENTHAYGQLKGLNETQIKEILAKKYKISQKEKDSKSPVNLYTADDYTFGIINPHSSNFCTTCNRIRLTAEGFLVPCLYFDEALSIKEAVKNKDIKKASEILYTVIKNKPEKNKWGEENEEISSRAFYQTGG